MMLGFMRALLWLSITVMFAMTAWAQQPASQTRDDSISGRVVSELGQPLSGASISVNPIGGRGGQRTTTDGEGHFRVQGLDGGIYRISAGAPGYVTQQADTAAPAFRPGDNAEITLIKGGVISGNVTNIAGEPVVNISMHVYRIRDGEGKGVERPSFVTQPKFTDDRGYYRIYGIPPGTYVVAAGGPGQYFGLANPFANDAMTYAPSSTRDTAAEIVLRSNQEATADIRYRNEPAHVVSGRVSGVQLPLQYNPIIRLTDVDSRIVAASMTVISPDRTFQLNGVSDGEYEIVAIGGGGAAEVVSSNPRHISVKGVDVTGLDLALANMAAIDGRVNIESDQKLNCGRRRDTALRETMITLRRARPEEKVGAAREKPAETADSSVSSSFDSVPNEKGEVRFHNLSPGSYRFEIRLPAAGWYLKELTLGKPEPNIARNGIALKQGEKIGTVAITIAEGGASLRGRVTAAEGQTLPPSLRVYLAPAARENSDNPLRFFEAVAASDGTFAVGNIAPGRYWIVAEAAELTGIAAVKTTRTDAGWRAKILRDATASNKDITFKPCERTADYEFGYSPTKP